MAPSESSDRDLYALLLAGGEAPRDIQAADGARKLCLSKLGGITLLERALRTICSVLPDSRVLVNLGHDNEGISLVEGAAFGKVICYSGAPDVLGALEQALDLLQVEYGEKALNADLLLMTVDIPLLTSEQLGEFIGQAQTDGAEGVWPIVERAVVEAKY